MEEIRAGWKNESLELGNLVKFFLIAFGWTWIIWSLFISEIIKLPAGIGTPNVDIGELLGVLPIVNTLNLVLILAIYGYRDMIRDRQST